MSTPENTPEVTPETKPEAAAEVKTFGKHFLTPAEKREIRKLQSKARYFRVLSHLNESQAELIDAANTMKEFEGEE